MKPAENPAGSPFNFNFVAKIFIPKLWDEKYPMKFRGGKFILTYIFSTVFFFAIIILPIAVVFSRPIVRPLNLILYFGVPFGVACGLAAWWDFSRRKDG